MVVVPARFENWVGVGHLEMAFLVSCEKAFFVVHGDTACVLGDTTLTPNRPAVVLLHPGYDRILFPFPAYDSLVPRS